MKYLLLLLCSICLSCYAYDFSSMTTTEIINNLEHDELNLQNSENINKDFIEFYQNLYNAGIELNKRELSLEINSIYYKIKDTNLFIVNENNWSFVIPNNEYLEHTYKSKLNKYWKEYLRIVNSETYYNYCIGALTPYKQRDLKRLKRLYQKYPENVNIEQTIKEYQY